MIGLGYLALIREYGFIDFWVISSIEMKRLFRKAAVRKYDLVTCVEIIELTITEIPSLYFFVSFTLYYYYISMLY